MSSQILFFLSALGAFNGLLLSLFLFASKPRTAQRLLLGGLLLMVSLRITKSIWFFYEPSVGKLFLQLGLSACFLIGPFMYVYVNSVVNKQVLEQVHWRLHLIIAVILLVVVGSLYPYQSNVELWGQLYRIINYIWGTYLVLTGYKIYTMLNLSVKGKAPLNNEQKLCLHVFSGTSIIWLAYFTASYTSYIVGALSFSFIVYISAMVWLLPRNIQEQYKDKKISYATKKIEQGVVAQVEADLTKLMCEEQLYKNPNLTLPMLAKKLQISVPQLSQILNDNFSQSFASYVNNWRIQEAKRLLLENQRMTMEQVAELSGYNSQSTFYASFKQFVNCTPAKYRINALKAKN